jgi:hypothetical protein
LLSWHRSQNRRLISTIDERVATSSAGVCGRHYLKIQSNSTVIDGFDPSSGGRCPHWWACNLQNKKHTPNLEPDVKFATTKSISAIGALAVTLVMSAAPASAGDASDIAEDAVELNEKIDADCSGRLGAKLDAVADALSSAGRRPSRSKKRAVKKVVNAAIDFAEDRCDKRHAQRIVEKLEGVLEALETSETSNSNAGDSDRGQRATTLSAKIGAPTVRYGTNNGQPAVEIITNNVTVVGTRAAELLLECDQKDQRICPGCQ